MRQFWLFGALAVCAACVLGVSGPSHASSDAAADPASARAGAPTRSAASLSVASAAAGGTLFSGAHVSVGAARLTGQADASVDWLNRFGANTYSRDRANLNEPWGAYKKVVSQRRFDALLDRPGNNKTKSLSDSVDLDGYAGDLRVGYDLDFGQWVVGASAGVGLADYSGSGDVLVFHKGRNDPSIRPWRESFEKITRTASLDVDSDWQGSIRARAGYKLDPKTLVYATGGLSAQNFEVSITNERGETVAEDSKTLLGYSVGAGVERLLTDKVFVSLDYLYTDFASMTVSGDNAFIEDDASVVNGGKSQWGHLHLTRHEATVEPDMHAVWLRVGYRF